MIDDLSGSLVKANIYFDEGEWKIFSTICVRQGNVDVCTDSINGYILALVRKSYKKSLQDMIKEKIKCSHLLCGKRNVQAREKKVIFTFKCEVK